MLTNVLYELFHFNIGFFISLILDNLFWVFAFVALSFFTSGGKKVIKNTLILIIIVYFMKDFFSIIGFVPFIGSNGVLFIGFFYLVLPIFIEKTSFEKHFRKLLVSGILTYSVLSVFFGIV